MLTPVKKLVSKFIKCARGVAVTEFAIIGPVLVALLVFSINGFDAYRGLRKASSTVDMVGDIATRKLEITAADRDSLFVTAEALLDQYADGVAVELIMTSVEQDEDDNYVVLWSFANDNATAHDAVLPAELIAELPQIPEGESLIVTELDFQFQPTLADLWVGSVNVDQFSISRPRMVAQIAYAP